MKTPVVHRILREENLADIGVRRPAAPNDAAHAVIDPDTGAEFARIRVDYLKCAAPAFADGNVFLRTRKGVVCYDLIAK
jgi:hypothetical protein